MSTCTPNGKRNRRMNWRRILLTSALALFLVAFFAVASVYVFLSGLAPEENGEDNSGLKELPQPEPDARIHVLVMGIDADDVINGGGNSARSDTLFLVTFDPLTKESSVLFLPRDTRVDIPGRNEPEKLAHAHAYGGPERVIETVTNFLDVPIHYYARVDFSAFVGVIDVLGGVTLDVEEYMYYEDPTQNLYIDIPPGIHEMDGETALKFVRYRNGSDIDRIGRQKDFLRALFDEMLQIQTVTKIPALASKVTNHVDTNMPPARIISLSQFASSMSGDDLTIDLLPGRAGYLNGISYWFTDQEEIEELIEALVLGIRRPENEGISVAVYNGGGIPGAASDVARRLERLGYFIAEIGDAEDLGDDRYSQTRVEICPETDPFHGKHMVRVLNVIMSEGESAELYTIREGTIGVDGPVMLAIYVGEDYQGLAR